MELQPHPQALASPFGRATTLPPLQPRGYAQHDGDVSTLLGNLRLRGADPPLPPGRLTPPGGTPPGGTPPGVSHSLDPWL